MAEYNTLPKEKTLLSGRVRRLKEGLLQIEPRLSCERLRFLKESYKETEGEPTLIRVAKAYEKHLCGMTIFIDENPIVGTLTRYRCGTLPFPEISCDWMVEKVDFNVSGGKLIISDEDRKLLEESVAYWRDKCKWHKARKIFSEKYGVDYKDYYDSGFFCTVGMTPYARLNIDYAKVLNLGFEGIIGEAEAELKKLHLGPQEDYRKKVFLESVVIVCNAVVKFARRYASLARDMAREEKSPERKEELLKIAETCEWVPAKPARSFYEAVQSFWFTHLAAELEAVSSGISPGRFPLYMYPFLKKDKEEGKINDEQAIELLELLFVKFTEVNQFLPPSFFNFTMGSLFQNMSIGGVTATGEDATNDLDYLVLEAQKRVQLIQPTLSLLYHSNLSPKLLLKCIEVIRTGIGMPAFFNNEVTMARLLNHGATVEEARNCCVIGCVEGSFSHTTSTHRGIGFDMPKMLEMALNNGKDPRTGKQWGIKTGDPLKFETYAELHEAVKKQFQYFEFFHEEFEAIANVLGTEINPRIYLSALVDDCIKNGKEINDGGSRHRMDGNGPTGVVNLADALAAIKKLVFEEKTITMEELLKALKANFEGYQEIHKMCLDVPKYGNDNDYVDQITREWYNIYYEEHQKYKDHLGQTRRPNGLSITFQFPFGMNTGALPSGRKAEVPFADGTVSPEPGMDRNGPTALIRSATKVFDCTKYACNLLNMKFHPTALKDEESQRKLLALIETYMNLGGHHVQFNVVSSQTLRDAQKHPENYRSLIVRVAGFSAFFIYLDPIVQDEVIKRTELISV